MIFLSVKLRWFSFHPFCGGWLQTVEGTFFWGGRKEGGGTARDARAEQSDKLGWAMNMVGGKKMTAAGSTSQIVTLFLMFRRPHCVRGIARVAIAIARIVIAIERED